MYHLTCMFWIIILLKHYIPWIQIVMLNCRPQEVFQNKFVHMPIHHTFNSLPSSRSKSCYTTPNHDMSTTMFDCLLDMLRLDMFFIFNPILGITIGIKSVYLRLITEDNTFPIMNHPICIPSSKPQPCQNMLPC